MGRNSSGMGWEPSKGTYGWLGTHSGSKAGRKRRGLTAQKDTVVKGADQNLAVLLRQKERAEGGESIYDVQLGIEAEEAAVAEEGFIEEAERQATALREGVKGQTKAIESQQAQTGFAGSGTTVRAREDLAQSIQEKGGDIYEDLTRQQVTQDLAMEKKISSTKHEQATELDMIEKEASTIISQAEEAVMTIDKAFNYTPKHPLSTFAVKPPEGEVG